MPTRVLIHLPDPDPPQLVDRPDRRPARGEEFPTGWTCADYQLERGDFEGQEYAYEVWVVPLLEPDSGASQTTRPLDHDTLTHMLTLCGREITRANADHLIEALTDAGTHASVEAAAAIRWHSDARQSRRPRTRTLPRDPRRS